MKRALITGSEGFAGSHLRTELELNGYQVFGTVLKEPLGGLEKDTFVCDITVRENLAEIINEVLPDYIFHLAGQAAPALSFKDPQLTIEINTIGTINLLEVIRKIPEYHPRILLIGTSEEYGIVPPEFMPVTEEQTLNPVSPYSVSKAADYFLAKIYKKSFNLDIVYACSFNHTGPGQRPGFLAPDVASQIVDIERNKQKPVLMTGNLDTFRDYTDVRDVVRAYRLLLEKGQSGERYNVCSGESVSTKYIVDTLVNSANLKIDHQIDPSRNRPSDMPMIKGSNKKLVDSTGWKPEIPLDKTLKDLLEWYRNKE